MKIGYGGVDHVDDTGTPVFNFTYDTDTHQVADVENHVLGTFENVLPSNPLQFADVAGAKAALGWVEAALQALGSVYASAVAKITALQVPGTVIWERLVTVTYADKTANFNAGLLEWQQATYGGWFDRMLQSQIKGEFGA